MRTEGRLPASAVKAMRGFSMLELLVAVLVVGVGVLGVASLGVANLRQARAAASQAEVVRLAEDLAERIRANPAGLAAGAYASSGAAAGADCTGGPCTPTQMAAADLAAWLCALGASEQEDCRSAISAQGEVAVEQATGRFAIQITWRDAGGERALRLRSAG